MRRLPLLLLVGCLPAPDDDAPDVTSVVVDADAFGCVTDMQPVRRFYVDNLLGDLDATLAVAASPEGRRWPTGSLVQLVPFEAMVKREPGFSPATDDWEFFFLSAEAGRTTILARGGAEVENGFGGGSCAGCHAAAADSWDWICEQGHGCVDLPLSEEAVRVVQERDPRCP